MHLSVGFIGRFCEFVDRCHLENPCHPSATCTTSIVDGRLTCFCAAGFTGQTCSIRIRKNICEKRPCYKNGTCRLDNSNEDGFVCDCVPGYRGKLCDEAVIENPCDGNPCANSGTCQPDGFGKFVCSCPPGYWGTRCELKAEPAALCPCRNGGHCLTVDGGTACSCPLGFNGPNCENNIGSCSAAASAAPDGVVCHNGGDCLDKVGGGFRCRCPAGWFGDRCASRANPCQSRPCANSALCRPAPNWVNFSCDCSTADGGFSGPLSLDDIDECQAAGRCDSDGTQRCLNTVGSFKCVCKPGFVGEHCDRRADRCASVVCLNGGWCDPADGSCRCQPEFDGFDCFRPRDNCFPSPCLNGGQCRTLVDAYVCTCPPGYGGLDCEKVNACSNSSCLGRGTCRVEQRIAASAAAAAGQPDFRCDCHSGFGGQFCQDRIRGGAVLSRGSGCSDSLCSGVGRCFNDSGTILCQCPFGYSGRRCESPVNPCDSNPCRRGGTCVAGLANGDPTNYTCLCKPGFQGPHCEANINECANGGACDPRGTEVCIDGVASFTCRCLPGFTGQLCNRSIDYCLPTATPKPPRCLNGGVCRSDRRQPTPGAVCDCPAGYHGPLCQLTFDPCAAASAVCQNGGVCEIVGANRTRCICPPGTAGLRCEIDYINSCKSSASPTGESPCHGDQSECRDLPEGFRCRCQPGLCGPTCDRECPTLEEERSSCRMHGCQTKAGNGVCDPDCDSLACDWDGGDCASGWQPWANCTAARSGDAGGCIAGYGDGLCQLECSDQRCLFDGGDCDASTSAPPTTSTKATAETTSLTADATLVATPPPICSMVATVCRPVRQGSCRRSHRRRRRPPAT
ncbi:hypothetical protein BOX15_Mlig029643g1 [Macrostomum lignano]|uniref:Uncharacterized protein n=1 Tax=Macrostomum lignano TaxID=282301 RepID=A0A267ED17_9PLAT|nr:hypothetical protein BOX15_Mlig029643g1 [Macrostomum lignano]